MNILLLVSVALSKLFIDHHPNPDAILGVWRNSNNRAHIEIYRQGSRYYGKILWLKNQVDEYGKPKIDKRNPEPELRSRTLIGLVTLRDLEFDDGEWSGGYIYNPGDGKEYNAFISLIDNNTIAVRGYVGISLFGKTDVWSRVH
jgi:uncharacterized protein (DUF2147 family)